MPLLSFVPTRLSGAEGAVATRWGVALTAFERGPVSAAFTAATWYQYVEPFVSPESVYVSTLPTDVSRVADPAVGPR
jgi:hypothetical protein